MRDFTVFDVFSRNGNVNPEKVALVFGESTYTFRQLLSGAALLAENLRHRGIGSGDRLAVLAFNHPAIFMVFGAAACTASIVVPMNWRLSAQELTRIISDCEPSVLFADEHQLPVARQLAEPLGIPVLHLDHAASQATEQDSVAAPFCSAANDSPLCILYTAAVEGVPRGAVLNHSNLLAANLQVILTMGITAEDVHLAMLPLFHITGLNLALATMQQGGCNIVIEKFDERAVLHSTLEHGVTIWGSFPPILGRMAEEISRTEQCPSTLKHVVGLDGVDTISRFEEMTGAVFWILYGQAETSGFVTFSPALARPGTAGQQGPLSIFSLVDDQDQEVDHGETGEIVVRGPLVFQGYWRQDELTAWTFRNGWHHTGDFGQLDKKGFLLFKGRKPEKELIKPGGENVYPAEVEMVIMQHPALAAVSVIGVPDPRFGEGVKAVCVLKPGAAVSSQELIEFVGTRIARYKKPKYVQFVQTLPMKDNRIDRQEVKRLYGEANPV